MIVVVLATMMIIVEHRKGKNVWVTPKCLFRDIVTAAAATAGDENEGDDDAQKMLLLMKLIAMEMMTRYRSRKVEKVMMTTTISMTIHIETTTTMNMLFYISDKI